ncbi:MAG TPA: cupin domain-containing protein [Thermoanaerobaculia bacterium]|jgi:putative transcriptional regulator
MHPPEDTLLALASGEADLPLRVTLEGHLSTCPACRATVGELAAAGGAMLRELADEPLPQRVWESLAARVAPMAPDATAVRAPRRAPGAADPLAALPLPSGARRELRLALAGRPDREREVAWRTAWAPGARYAVLWSASSLLVVGHLPAGRYFPRHVHPGREDVLVLAGGYDDHLGSYTAGEYAVYDAGSDHRPTTSPDEECWILSRLEAPARFLGWRGWLQALGER